MYVRRGDKHKKMQLLNFLRYAEEVEIIVKNENLKDTKYEYKNKKKNGIMNEADFGPNDSKRKPLLFIGTEGALCFEGSDGVGQER